MTISTCSIVVLSAVLGSVVGTRVGIWLAKRYAARYTFPRMGISEMRKRYRGAGNSLDERKD